MAPADDLPPGSPAPTANPGKRRAGRRQRGAESRRDLKINVHVSPLEFAQLHAKAAALHLSAAGFVRQAALARRLPPQPVAAVNREQYIELGRLAGDLHELTRLADAGRTVTVTDTLLRGLHLEVDRLRLALLGAESQTHVAGHPAAPGAEACTPRLA